MKQSLVAQLLALTLGIVATAVIVLFTLQFTQLSAVIDTADRAQLRQAHEAFMAELDMKATEAETLASYLSGLPGVSGDIAKGDRDSLQRRLVPVFEAKKGETGITQMHAHTPDVRSFLRLNQTQKFGDDLSGIRPMLVDVNRTRQRRRGLEGGVVGTAIRGVVPVFYDGRHVGSFEAGFYLDNRFLRSIQPTGLHYTIYLEEKGQRSVAASTLDRPEPFLPKADLDRAQGGAEVVGHVAALGTEWGVLAVPLKDFQGKVIGVVELARDDTAFVAAYRSAIGWAVGVAAVVLAGAVVLAVLFSRRLTGPLRELTAAMERLAGGRTDVAVAHADRADEIGAMARALLVFRENKETADHLAAERRRAEEERQRRAETVERLITEFDRSVQTVAQAVSAAAAQMEGNARELSALAEQTSERAVAVASASEEAAASVETVAASSGHLSESVRDIGQRITESTRIADAAVEEARQTDQTVSGLAEAAQRIGEVVELINSIAAQTNLLALNATIEAARAGEAGKGFAVVASEVKSLANQTAKATEDIQRQVAQMQSVTESTVDAIKRIADTIARMSEITGFVAAAVDTQAAATGEIAHSVDQARSGAYDVTRNIAEVSTATARTGRMAADVLGAAGGLARQAEALKADVHGFLERVRAA